MMRCTNACPQIIVAFIFQDQSNDVSLDSQEQMTQFTALS